MLRLTDGDRRHLAEAMDVLLRPEEADPEVGYRRAVLGVVKPLIGADKACYVTHLGDDASWVSDYPQAPLSDYGVRLGDVAPGVDIWARHESLGVTRRDDLWLPICPDFYETAYYCDYVVPLRAFDGMGVNWRVGPGAGATNMVKLLVHHDSATGPRFGDREYAILQLLRPALVSGLAHARLGPTQRAEVFEALADPAFVLDAEGRILDANHAARKVLGDEAHMGAAVRQALESGFGSSTPGETAVPRPVVRVDLGGYPGTLRFTRLPLGGDRGTGFLVTLDGLPKHTNDLQARGEGLGLTSRQAEVAGLMCERLRSREIAERLEVSLHTVRRHEEQVLLRLGVQRRTDVEGALLGDASSGAESR